MCTGKAMVFLKGSAYGLSGKHEERRKMVLRHIHHVQLAMPGYRRAYVNDPFGNRIELLEACPAS